MAKVSVIIPCRNEGSFIGPCLESIVAMDYPMDLLDILIVDGMSDDETRSIVSRYIKKWPCIRLLDNPQKITPAALNIGIKNSSGEIILRMDAHATYDPSYIVKSVQALKYYNADDVGGVWKVRPRNISLLGKSIAQAMSHRFGIGNAAYRIRNSGQPKWVDTVPFFCCRRETLDEIGMFNENLERGQDMEFNQRLKNAGGKILLVPDIVSYYFVRSDLKSFLKHNWVNGMWALLPFKYVNSIPIRWRHIVPLMFVMALLVFCVVALVWPDLSWMLLLVTGVYVLANIIASVNIAFREKEFSYFFTMPLIFSVLHLSYGMGSLMGLFKVLKVKLRII